MNTIDRELIAALSGHFFPVRAAPERKRKAKEIRAANRARVHKVGKATKSFSCTEGGRRKFYDDVPRGTLHGVEVLDLD